jgi:hypothetical protein
MAKKKQPIVKLAEPSRESLLQIGREALASLFRGAALKCVLKFQLTNEDIESVAGDIMREVDAYMSENDAA